MSSEMNLVLLELRQIKKILKRIEELLEKALGVFGRFG